MRRSDWSAAQIIYPDSSEQQTRAREGSLADANESFFRPQRTPTAYLPARTLEIQFVKRNRSAIVRGRRYTRIRISRDEAAARQPARPE
jgi:hypothetical protein